MIPNNRITEFKPIRNNVLNSLLLYMSIGSLPLLATSLFLFYSSGWKISMATDTIGLLSLPIIYLLRNKINYNLKTGYLIFMGYATGILVLHDYSFFGTGLIILSSVTLISTLFFGMKAGWLLMIANTIGIGTIGILYKFNYLDYNFDVTKYIYSSITLADHLVTFLFFIGLVVIASGQIHNELLNLIRQSRTEKEKFKGLFNNIQDAIMIFNKEGEILEMNNSLLEMYGVGRNLVFVSKLKDFSILTLKELSSGENQEQLKTKKQYEAKAQRFDNRKEFFIEVMLSPIKYGEQKAILANIRDISQRKMSEEALRQSEEKYRSLIESSPAAIFIAQNEKFTYINPSGAKRLGYTSIEELSGKDVFSVLAPEFKNSAELRLNKALSGTHHFPTEIKVFKKDGSEMWAETVSIPIEYYGSPAVLIMGFDITERKKAEALIIQKNKEIESRNYEYAVLNRKLKIAKEKAEESDRLKSAFLSNMSHEIRTPMNAILGFSDLLIRATLSEKKRVEYIEIINSSGNQLLSLINDIIDISKIESNQIVIDIYSQVNIYDVFKQLSVIFSAKAKSSKIHLEFKIQMDEAQALVYLDEIRLKQILVNLIGNALKFTHKGFVNFDVKIKNRELLFSIEDSGIGIDAQQLAIIFERFRQADGSTTRDYGGTGLGLAISRALVELMGGKIWVDSVPDKGTVFYFTMPYRPCGEVIIEDGSPIDINNEEQLWSEKQILLVEDEEVNILFLTELLKSTGITILIARNSSEAYEKVSNNRAIDVILMDIKIPKVDGYEITRVIKESRPDIPVIAQTAYALAEERKKILESGFDDYISKPINKGILFNLLTRYLGKS